MEILFSVFVVFKIFYSIYVCMYVVSKYLNDRLWETMADLLLNICIVYNVSIWCLRNVFFYLNSLLF